MNSQSGFNHIAGYNLPRFFEVEVCHFVECDSFNGNQKGQSGNGNVSSWKYHIRSNETVLNCFNVTDVIKTDLRESDIYISVFYLIYKYFGDIL